ncbi:MAG: tetratricopeptide repeat protein [Patescibacteria group bacterium]
MTKILKKISPYFGALLIVYLLGNIVASQNVSPIYYNLSDSNISKKNLYDETFGFLVSIRNLPEFEEFLPRFEAVFGNIISDDIKKHDEKQTLYFENLEFILDKNPKSRDALLKLYLYYIQQGNPEKAQEYLDKAKEIDPTLSNF